MPALLAMALSPTPPHAATDGMWLEGRTAPHPAGLTAEARFLADVDSEGSYGGRGNWVLSRELPLPWRIEDSRPT